jgi:hypothetical protein
MRRTPMSAVVAGFDIAAPCPRPNMDSFIMPALVTTMSAKIAK